MTHFFTALLARLGLTTGGSKSVVQSAVSLHKNRAIAIAQIQRQTEGAPKLLTCLYSRTHNIREQQHKLIELSAAHDFNAGRCYSLFNRDQFSLFMVEAPAVGSTELQAALRWQINDLIDFHIDEAVIDVFDIPEQKDRGHQKMIYVVVSRTADVQQHIDCFENNDINLDAIDIPELALRNIATLLPENSGGVALLHIDQLNTLLTICHGGKLYLTRYIDAGLQEIMQLLGSPKGPNDLAFEDDNGLPLKVYGVLEAVTLELQRSLDYYESNFSMPPVSGVVVTPMEEDLPWLIPYLSSNLGTVVRMLDFSTLLDVEGPMSHRLQAQCLDVIGLALRDENTTL